MPCTRWAAAADGAVRGRHDADDEPLFAAPILDGEGGRTYYVGGYARRKLRPGPLWPRAAVGTPTAVPNGPPSVTVNQGTWEPE